MSMIETKQAQGRDALEIRFTKAENVVGCALDAGGWRWWFSDYCLINRHKHYSRWRARLCAWWHNRVSPSPSS